MVSPNPSSSAFKMFIQSKTNAPISITTKDAIGRIIQKMNVSKNEIVITGDNLISGIYFAEIIQGVNHKTLKLIKLK